MSALRQWKEMDAKIKAGYKPQAKVEAMFAEIMLRISRLEGKLK